MGVVGVLRPHKKKRSRLPRAEDAISRASPRLKVALQIIPLIGSEQYKRRCRQVD